MSLAAMIWSMVSGGMRGTVREREYAEEGWGFIPKIAAAGWIT
jgi:hypothetical protein